MELIVAHTVADPLAIEVEHIWVLHWAHDESDPCTCDPVACTCWSRSLTAGSEIGKCLLFSLMAFSNLYFIIEDNVHVSDSKFFHLIWSLAEPIACQHRWIPNNKNKNMSWYWNHLSWYCRAHLIWSANKTWICWSLLIPLRLYRNSIGSAFSKKFSALGLYVQVSPL